jgi:hypothetical protein
MLPWGPLNVRFSIVTYRRRECHFDNAGVWNSSARRGVHEARVLLLESVRYAGLSAMMVVTHRPPV